MTYGMVFRLRRKRKRRRRLSKNIRDHSSTGEQRPCKPKVASSNLAGSTKYRECGRSSMVERGDVAPMVVDSTSTGHPIFFLKEKGNWTLGI